MKRIIGLVLGLVLVNSLFALDFNKIEEVWDKSMDIASAELDNLKDSDIPKAEDVEKKVDKEMYVTELEIKVKQLETEVSLLKKEKDELEKENKRARNVNDELRSELLFYNTGRGIYLSEREWDSIELEIKLLEKENDRLKELLKRKIK